MAGQKFFSDIISDLERIEAKIDALSLKVTSNFVAIEGLYKKINDLEYKAPIQSIDGSQQKASLTGDI